MILLRNICIVRLIGWGSILNRNSLEQVMQHLLPFGLIIFIELVLVDRDRRIQGHIPAQPIQLTSRLIKYFAFRTIDPTHV